MKSASDLINNVVNQFIVKPNGSPGYIGSKGFVFDIIGDENAMFDSDITDHFTETNYSIQDHIALRPPRFTLSGYVGELTDIFQMAFVDILTTIESMSAIGDHTFAFGAQAAQVYAKIAAVASKVGMVLNQASNAYQILTGASISTSKQQTAYNYFVSLYMDRTLCQVETPWAVWQNMAIESIRILQKADNKMVTEFAITFKQIRTVTTTSYTPINATFNGKTAEIMWREGRAKDANIPTSFIAGSISGQSILTDGTPVSTNLLSQNINSGLI